MSFSHLEKAQEIPKSFKKCSLHVWLENQLRPTQPGTRDLGCTRHMARTNNSLYKSPFLSYSLYVAALLVAYICFNDCWYK